MIGEFSQSMNIVLPLETPSIPEIFSSPAYKPAGKLLSLYVLIASLAKENTK